MWEAAYKALEKYDTLFNKHYEKVTLANATGYQTPTDTYSGKSSATKAGIGSLNTGSALPQTSTETKKESSNVSTKTATSDESQNNSPALTVGSRAVVKKSASNYSTNSGGVAMSSWVPGSSFTVSKITGDQVLLSDSEGYIGWVWKKDLEGYANGTSSAAAGLRRVNELGAETLFTSKDGSKYRLFSGGEKVLNAQASNFLYSFANSGAQILNRLFEGLSSPFLGFGSNRGLTPAIEMGDIIINGNVSDQRTVSEIRRSQREAVDYMLKQFNKLGR